MSSLAGQSIVILGCGYLGMAVAGAAVRAGARVTALTRNEGKAAELRAAGLAEVVVADLATDDWHGRIPAPDHVVDCVGSGAGGLEGYRRSYVDGLHSAERWLERVDGTSGSFCYTGSTGVYPQDDGNWVTEDAPTGGGGQAQVLLEAERLASGLAGRVARRSFVLRLAGIYGPGRHGLLDLLRAGAEVVPAGNHHLNLIHRDDAAAAVLACLGAEATVAGGAFNVADGRPMRREELAMWLAARMGRPAPRFEGERMGRGGRPPLDRKISPRRIEAALGWRAEHADACAGYETLLGG